MIQSTKHVSGAYNGQTLHK